MPNETNHEKEIFSSALEITSAEARLIYVRKACWPDHALRERIETLLEAYKSRTSFIPGREAVAETPIAAVPLHLSEGPGTVIDRYKLLETIGQGGFGSVYVAEQREP